MSSKNDKLLDFRALETFSAAMSLGSMTAAARRLGISQPAVTRLVRDLEQNVGFQLFHRNGPRISPTDRGLRFYEEASRILAGMRQLHARAEAIREEREASIDLAATPTMSGGLVGGTLARISSDLPPAINAQTMDAEHVVRHLRARTADFGLTSFPLDHAGLERHVVCESACVAVLSEDDPLVSEEAIALDVLHQRRLVTVGNAYRLRRAIDEALVKARVKPNAEFSTNSSLNAVMAARAGLGVAIVDPVTAYGIPVKGTALKPLAVRVPYFWGLFTVGDRALSGLMLSFVTAFRETCADVVPDCRFRDDAVVLGNVSEKGLT